MLTEVIKNLWHRSETVKPQEVAPIEEPVKPQSAFEDTPINLIPVASDEPEDFLRLREHWIFERGVVFEMSLQELLSICPRKRRKADAYKGLISSLKKRYDIDLVITKNQKHGTKL